MNFDTWCKCGGRIGLSLLGFKYCMSEETFSWFGLIPVVRNFFGRSHIKAGMDTGRPYPMIRGGR